jgi:hypothetical protein
VRLVETLRQFLGVRRYIKMDGVSNFDQLEPGHIPAMIRAFLDGENDQFDDGAFVEFLNWRVRNPAIVQLQPELSENSFLAPEGDGYPQVNEPFLRDFLDRFEPS